MGSLPRKSLGRRARPVGIALLAAAAIGLLATGCGRTPPGVTPGVGVTNYAVGERPELPEVAGTTLAGGQLAVADFAGSVVVLNSWASWCAPCVEEMPELIAASASTAGPDVVFVGLNVKDDPDKAREFAKQQQIPYESIMDPAGATLATLPDVPPGSLPSTLVIDRTGLIAARIIGPIPPGVLPGIVEAVAAE